MTAMNKEKNSEVFVLVEMMLIGLMLRKRRRRREMKNKKQKEEKYDYYDDEISFTY